MVCNNCGEEVDANAKFCPHCGKEVLNSNLNQENLNNKENVDNQEIIVEKQGVYQNNINTQDEYSNQQNNNQNIEEKANIGLAILSFLIPLAGLIIFIVKKDKETKTAKTSGICAVVRFVLNIIIVSFAFFAVFFYSSKVENEMRDTALDTFDKIIEKVEEANDDINNEIDDESTDKEVSSKWSDYEVVVNNKSIKLPCTYSELTNATGFKMKSAQENSMLSSNYYTLVNMYKDDKLALYTEILNDTNGDIKYTDGKITRISQTKYQVSNGADAFTFPGGIKAGDEITESEIVSKYGEPTKKDNYSSNNYESVTYKYNANTNWTTTNYFEIKIVNGIIDEITLDNRDY